MELIKYYVFQVSRNTEWVMVVTHIHRSPRRYDHVLGCKSTLINQCKLENRMHETVLLAWSLLSSNKNNHMHDSREVMQQDIGGKELRPQVEI
jgi:hypothetical protein